MLRIGFVILFFSLTGAYAAEAPKSQSLPLEVSTPVAVPSASPVPVTSPIPEANVLQNSNVGRIAKPSELNVDTIRTFKELADQKLAIKANAELKLDELSAKSPSAAKITEAAFTNLTLLLQLDSMQASYLFDSAEMKRTRENWDRFFKIFSAADGSTLNKKSYAVLAKLRKNVSPLEWRNFLFAYIDSLPLKVIDSSFNVLLLEKCTADHFWNQYGEALKCVEHLNNSGLKFLDEKAQSFVKYLECSSYFESGNLTKIEEFRKKHALTETIFLPTNATYVSLLKDEMELKYREGWKKLGELLSVKSVIKPQMTEYGVLLRRRIMYLAETKNLKLAETEVDRIIKLNVYKPGSRMFNELAMYKSLILVNNKKVSEGYSTLPNPVEWKSYNSFDDYLLHVGFKCALARNLKLNSEVCKKWASDSLSYIKGLKRGRWRSQAIETIVELSNQASLTPENTQKLNSIVAESEKNRDSAVIKEAAKLLLGI